MTILLLYTHKTIIRWIPIPPTTHEPILLTRLTWTQNSFIILISKIRCIFFTLVFCSNFLLFQQFHRKAKRQVSIHLAYITILLFCNYHTAIIRWIPLTVQICRSILLNSLVKCVRGVFLMCAYQ